MVTALCIQLIWRFRITSAEASFEPSIVLPEPITGIRPVRYEQQQWQRLGRAEGRLKIGYNSDDKPVRIEYHWMRYFSKANPDLADVYTAELWVRQADGNWLYIIQPSQSSFVAIEHEPLKALLAEHLNIDLAD